jgi:hypothetical protein
MPAKGRQHPAAGADTRVPLAPRRNGFHDRWKALLKEPDTCWPRAAAKYIENDIFLRMQKAFDCRVTRYFYLMPKRLGGGA